MSRSTGRAPYRCQRGIHRLVWLEVDENEPIVCWAAVAPGRDKLHWGVSRAPAASIRGPVDDPYTRHATMVGCACKARYDVDLIAFLNGDPARPRRMTGDTFPGVSLDR